MKKNALKLLLACAALSLSVAAQAASYNLGDLIDNHGSFTVGDKTFSDFGWDQTAVGGSIDPASAVTITTLTSGGLYGIELHLGLFSGGPGAAFSDAKFTYKVTAGSGWLITDLHHSIVGGGTTNPNKASSYWSISSAETASIGGFGGLIVGVSDVGKDSEGSLDLSDPPGEASDVLEFPGYQSLYITKDIGVFSIDASAQISVVDQQFSQKPTRVPDGASTVSLLGLVMLGVEGLRRKLGRK